MLEIPAHGSYKAVLEGLLGVPPVEGVAEVIGGPEREGEREPERDREQQDQPQRPGGQQGGGKALLAQAAFTSVQTRSQARRRCL